MSRCYAVGAGTLPEFAPGQLKLDELITREKFNEAYADRHARVNLRGLTRF